MSFVVPAESYLRFMGRYSAPLAEQFAGLAEVRPGGRVLDVGCGPGVLTATLLERYGEGSVAAIDPSPPFVATARERFPGVDVREGVAEHLPYPDDAFDSALAQLVVHFMSDPVAGLREMGRVTRPGGVVAACVWDHSGSGGPLSLFWEAARQVDPSAPDEADLPGSREGELAELARAAGLSEVETSTLTVRIPCASFEEWWEPYLLGVGPAGDYLAAADQALRSAVEQRCRELLPDPPFEHTATAWVVVARA